ncbi:MAG TPA: phosphoribosyltransferase family protein [Candidatus Acidoferrum sp.]
MAARKGGSFSAARLARRVAGLGKEISRAYKGRRLDVVITLDRSFVFAADLIRHIDAPVVCHFVREHVRDVEQGGHSRREVFFGVAPELKGRDVLLLDAVMDSGVTQEFLLRRLGESQPRSLRLAVLLDKTPNRRVGLEPDYFGFRTASKEVWIGYGLAAHNGMGGNERMLSSMVKSSKRQGRKS